MPKNKNHSLDAENIFADLGLANPAERLAKAKLAYQINQLIKQKKLTKLATAKLFSLNQPEITNLHKGKLADFSLEKLFSYLNILGQNITIKITPKIKSQSKASLDITIQKSNRRPTSSSVMLQAKAKPSRSLLSATKRKTSKAK